VCMVGQGGAVREGQQRSAGRHGTASVLCFRTENKNKRNKHADIFSDLGMSGSAALGAAVAGRARRCQLLPERVVAMPPVPVVQHPVPSAGPTACGGACWRRIFHIHIKHVAAVWRWREKESDAYRRSARQV